MANDDRIKEIAWSSLFLAVALGLAVDHFVREWKISTAAGIVGFFVICEIISKFHKSEAVDGKG